MTLDRFHKYNPGDLVKVTMYDDLYLHRERRFTSGLIISNAPDLSASHYSRFIDNDCFYYVLTEGKLMIKVYSLIQPI